MFSKLNPWAIVKAHFRSLKGYDTDQISWGEVGFHLLVPAAASLAHFLLIKEISENVVSIVVSAASIVAGLMLNLMVLIYTLVYNTRTREADRHISNFEDFKTLASETLSTISYSVVVCVFLVLFAFFTLSGWAPLGVLGRLGTVYFGVAEILCLLIVLKRCYGIVQFEVKQ